MGVCVELDDTARGIARGGRVGWLLLGGRASARSRRDSSVSSDETGSGGSVGNWGDGVFHSVGGIKALGRGTSYVPCTGSEASDCEFGADSGCWRRLKSVEGRNVGEWVWESTVEEVLFEPSERR
jgi:hypothetical protein